MRQRLLLVAGWAIAAVATSLVATAAVAVAGGQVTDRPLRPLTAAEVAALPVARAVDVSAQASPLPPAAQANERDPIGGAPSGGPRSSDAPDPAGDEGTLNPDDDVVLDPNDPDSAAPPDTSADDEAPGLVTEEAPTDDEPGDVTPDPDLTRIKVSHTPGGSVTVSARDGQILDFTARPRPGYRVSHEFVSETRLRVLFASDKSVWVISAIWVADDLEISEREEVR